jgi:hypothetical protein
MSVMSLANTQYVGTDCAGRCVELSSSCQPPMRREKVRGFIENSAAACAASEIPFPDREPNQLGGVGGG